MLTSKNCIFRVLKMMLSGAFCFHSEHSYACKELYEVPGGDQVDVSPPAPVKLLTNGREGEIPFQGDQP